MFAALLVLGCAGGERADQGASSPPAQETVLLAPDWAKTFATICQEDTLIGIIGDGWALRTVLPARDATLAAGEYSVPAEYVTGPDLGMYIHPPAGPPTPPIPADGRYATLGIGKIAVTVHQPAKAYGGPVIATFGVFKAGDSAFRLPGRMSIDVKGPYP